MKRIFQLFAILIMLATIGYFAMCTYANCKNPETTADYEMPNKNSAPYSLIAKNTATVILVDDYEVFGAVVGSRTYYINGYWELIGQEFVYRDKTLSLSEREFGEIELKRR